MSYDWQKRQLGFEFQSLRDIERRSNNLRKLLYYQGAKKI